MIVRFQEKHAYSVRSIGDQDCVFSITVASRTAKQLKTECGKTLRIAERDGVEFVRPLGNYSMAPIIRARVIEPIKEEAAQALEPQLKATNVYDMKGNSINLLEA